MSSDDELDYVLYRRRAEWTDIKPVPQDDGPTPVVQIAYTEKFKDCYDYFRAVLAKGEKSERSLELTETAISMNPANYTVWQFRREILQALNKDLREEMNFVSDIIMEQQKNYQVWHHRRALVEWSGDASQELDFTAKILHCDQKNYHAWQHRQWVIKEFGEWEMELLYVNSLLLIDVRNNSAWNQRYFVIKNTTGFDQSDDQVINSEIEFTLKKIDKALHNESAWNYLRGILKGRGLTWSSRVMDQVASWRNENIQSPQFLAFRLDIIDEQLENGADVKSSIAEAQKLSELLCKVDTVRRKYWKFVMERMSKKYDHHG